MKRLVLVGVLVAVFGSTSWAQPIEADIIYYNRAKKAQDTAKGLIVEETPGLIAYRVSGRVERIPAVDVLEVEYQPSSAVLRNEIRKVLRLEDEVEKAADAEVRKKVALKAMEGFQALLPQITDSRYPQRHMAFKIARLQARLAEDDPAEQDRAIAALSKFLQEHGSGWQVSRAARMLGQLQLEKGDTAAAQKTYKMLADKPDLAKETRQEYQLLSIRGLMRTGKHDEAQKELKSIQALLPADDALMKARVDIYLAGCRGASGDKKAVEDAEKLLQPMLEGNAEPPLKALACNTLAEVYLKAKRDEDAFWRYLMVDTLYNQDVEEHARALYHLSQLFDKVKRNPTRAQECRERLLKEKQFTGVEYRQLALKEK